MPRLDGYMGLFVLFTQFFYKSKLGIIKMYSLLIIFKELHDEGMSKGYRSQLKELQRVKAGTI